MSETEWTRNHGEWVRTLSDADILRLAAQINADAYLDENEGDRTERRESLEWLLSRGERGREWGIVGAAAEDLGLFPGGARDPA